MADVISLDSHRVFPPDAVRDPVSGTPFLVNPFLSMGVLNTLMEHATKDDFPLEEIFGAFIVHATLSMATLDPHRTGVLLKYLLGVLTKGEIRYHPPTGSEETPGE